MSFQIIGEHNTATVHTEQSREESEDLAIEQVQEMVDHEAFYGDSDIEIQPDWHFGAGAVIGFTMPVKDCIVPNTVGVDVGCGVLSSKFGRLFDYEDEETLEELDQEVRSRVPTGYHVHSGNDYHIVNDTPWAEIKRKYREFDNNTDFDLDDPDSVYHDDYITELCNRGGYDTTKAINSVGSLGSGNHFVEFSTDPDDNIWCTIHTGSRGLGASVASYWQYKATSKTTMRVSIDDVDSDVRKYMNDDWKPKKEKIREDFDGEAIQGMFDKVSQAIQEHGPANADRNTDLDYLEGSEAHGYIRDMVFLQTYASESRKKIMRAVEDAMDAVVYDAELNSSPKRYETIESVHNYIDFEDGVIRKGACRAHEDERVLIPINMKYGTIIATGRGNEDWNNSAPHGAGRRMSRTKAKDMFDDSDFDEQTSGVFMSKQPLDEIPGSYKSPDAIRDAVGESVDIDCVIEPFMSIKG